MNRPTHEQLVAFLEGALGDEARTHLLDHLEHDPQLARELRSAALGLVAVESLRVDQPPPQLVSRRGHRISPWWAAAAAAATLALAVPSTLWIASNGAPGPQQGQPPIPEPGFVLVLHGRWPDVATVSPEERQRRASEYWSWADSLASSSVLMAAGDLRQDPGRRFGPNAIPVSVPTQVVDSPDFVVGMLAISVGTYDEAVAIARRCPHLRYGGSVSVRQMATGLLRTTVGG